MHKIHELHEKLYPPHLAKGLSTLLFTLIVLINSPLLLPSSITPPCLPLLYVKADGSSGTLGIPVTNISSISWRAGHSAALTGNYMVIFGGVASPKDIFGTSSPGTNQVMVWNVNQHRWYLPQLANQSATEVPLGQKFAPAVASPNGKVLIRLTNATSGSGNLEQLDPNFWTWVFPPSSTSPMSSIGESLTLVNGTAYKYGGAYVMNGFPTVGANNLLYSLDTNTFAWTPLANGPSLAYHSACYMSRLNMIVVFGGQNADSIPLNSINTYDLSSGSWSLNVPATGAPSARRAHTAVCTESKMYMFGGGIGAIASDDSVWILDATSAKNFTWSEAPIPNKRNGPGARMGHSALLNDSKMIVYGGIGGNESDTNVYMFDIDSSKWTMVGVDGTMTDGQPDGADGNSSISNGQGGENGSGGSAKSSPKSSLMLIIGVVCSVVFVLFAAMIGLFVYRRYYYEEKDEKPSAGGSGGGGGSFGIRRRSKKFSIEEADRIRDVSYHETDDPNVNIMESGRSSRGRRSTINSDVQAPTPAAARIANKDTISSAAVMPMLHSDENAKQISSGSGNAGFSVVGTTGPMPQHSGNTPRTLSRKNIVDDDEDAEQWTFASSLQQNQGTTPPVRYMSRNNIRGNSGNSDAQRRWSYTPGRGQSIPTTSYDPPWVHHPYNYDEDDDDDSSVPLGLPVDVTAPRVPPNSAPIPPTLPSEYVSAARLTGNNSSVANSLAGGGSGDGIGLTGNETGGHHSSLPALPTNGGAVTMYDGLSPLDRIAQLFSGGDVNGTIVRSEKEGSSSNSVPTHPVTSSPQQQQEVARRTRVDVYNNSESESGGGEVHRVSVDTASNLRTTISVQNLQDAVTPGGLGKDEKLTYTTNRRDRLGDEISEIERGERIERDDPGEGSSRKNSTKEDVDSEKKEKRRRSWS